MLNTTQLDGLALRSESAKVLFNTIYLQSFISLVGRLMAANNQMPCDFCGAPYDPVSTRWLCPNCHMKTNCCDGAPCEIVEVKAVTNI